MTLIDKPNAWTIIFLLPIAGALLNLDLFGPQTLAAYFAYTFFAAAIAMIVSMRLLAYVKRLPLIDLPAPLLLFIALTLFIFLHGLVTHRLNLTHYYWVANAALLWAAWGQGEGSKRGIALLYKGVSLLALLESLIVCCQQIGLLSSKNPLYASTGTWENPNVTAMFLSLAVYAVLQGIKGAQAGRWRKDGRPVAAYMVIVLILLAILLLRCRTAVMVFALFITGHYWAGLSAFVKSKTRLPGRLIAVIAGVALTVSVLLLAFGVKRASTDGRFRIWENSIRLIGQKPLTGQGFGQFEKQYNLFTANEGLQENDHVNMPYNDFLELGVEGGLGAVALWASFLITLWIRHRKSGYSILPIIALLLIQLTNFGFQALPVFALFLLYVSIPPETAWREYPAAIRPSGKVSVKAMAIPTGDLLRQPLAGFRILGLGFIQLVSLFLVVHQVTLADDFYERNKITQNETGADAIEAYASLAASLKNFPSYHLYFGNAYLGMNQYRPALSQYLQGLESSSNPEMLVKCGYCYQQLRLFDSSRYYYTLVKNMEPYKFRPRLALLKLYQQQGDKPMTISEAEEIINMPVKVESGEVADIKNYARKTLEKESGSQ